MQWGKKAGRVHRNETKLWSSIGPLLLFLPLCGQMGSCEPYSSAWSPNLLCVTEYTHIAFVESKEDKNT